MSSLRIRNIAIYQAQRGGQPLGYALDRDALIDEFAADGNSGIVIRVHADTAAEIAAEIVNWNMEHPDMPRLKLHWFCPVCGQQHFDDWTPDDSNPTLRESFCDCIGWWLVNWARPTDNP